MYYYQKRCQKTDCQTVASLELPRLKQALKGLSASGLNMQQRIPISERFTLLIKALGSLLKVRDRISNVSHLVMHHSSIEIGLSVVIWS